LQGGWDSYAAFCRGRCATERSFRPPSCHGDGTQLALERAMADLIFVATILAFFALSMAYARVCDRL
jgi:hypothetical protein